MHQSLFVCNLKEREPARIMTAIGTKKESRWHLELKQPWVDLMDGDLSSAQHVLTRIVSGVEHDAVGVGRTQLAVGHVDAEQVRASPVNGCSTEDAGRGPGVVARRRQELDRMHSHRLRRSMILVLLLTLH